MEKTFTLPEDAFDSVGQVRKLIEMRRNAVARYGLFTPDSLYPIYECSSCKAIEVSLSMLASELDYYDSFSGYVQRLDGLVNALPLAPCKGCGSSNPAEPKWVGVFTFLAEVGEDLFLKIEGGKVIQAFRIPPLGAPNDITPLVDDESFLATFNFPFGHRWAWNHLIDGLSGKGTFNVRKIDEGYFFGIDPGSTDNKAWTGWFADRGMPYGLDGVVMLSQAEEEGFDDEGPFSWLEQSKLQGLEEGSLNLLVFYSLSAYKRRIQSTLLQRGINLSGEKDPFRIELDGYSCVVPLESLIRKAAFSACSPDRVFRHHLLSRIEYLEAIRGIGRRLREIFDENYLTSIRDGSVLEITDPESGESIRCFELAEISEQAMAPQEDFSKFLVEHLQFDSSTGLFKQSN